jgi:PAS domain S-box-containing protein
MDPALSATEYRLLTENSPVMVWRAGLDALCNYFNETWLAFTGRGLAQEMGNGWAEGVHFDDLDRCVAIYLDHFHRRQSFEMEYRLRRHDGTFRWILDRGVPFFDDSGAFAGFIGSCVDVHERRVAQDIQLQRTEEELANAKDFQRLILAVVSHDIRNPLHTIQLATRGLRNIGDAAGKIQGLTDVVGRGVGRIENIVSNLLDLSRAGEGGGIPVDLKSSDLAAVCRQAIEELKPISRDQQITFECEVDAIGNFDEHRISQAISNLVANAVQHGREGAGVHVRVVGDRNRIAAEIHNQGAIPPPLLPLIFEPFQSIRRGGKRGDGLGLGLFIAKAIARAHGGTLGVTSTDTYTEFRLEIPRRVPLNSQDAA